jgi:hypothetical protein
MKNIMFIAIFLMVLGQVVKAQDQTPVVDTRQKTQRVRIAQGVSSGEVTRTEARRLRGEQRRVRRTERRAKADGEVTQEEKAKITRKQNRASRDIRRQKHDGQERGN